MSGVLPLSWTEAEIRKTGFLPGSLKEVLAYGLERAGHHDWAALLDEQDIRVTTRDWLWWFSRREGGPPDMWVLGQQIRVRPGVWDDYASTPNGRAAILEEVIHVLQDTKNGRGWTITHLWWPWITGGQHTTIPAEQEAIQIADNVRKVWA